METLLSLSIALFAGLMLSRVAKIIKLPAVTAYLVAGVLLGPCIIGALGIKGIGFNSFDGLDTLAIISDVALGFIAFSIGNEFRLSSLKTIGKQATFIGIFQAVFTTILVDAVLIGLHFIIPEILPLPVAVILGAIASATAPAATLMVVRQYKAKGPVTSTLLPVVALDDAVGLVLFAVSFGVARALLSGSISIVSVLVEPVLEVVLSLGLGTIMGLLITYFEKFFHSRSKRLSMSVAFVLLTVGICQIPDLHFGVVNIAFSPLLSCMMLGTVFCNICDFSEELMDRLDRWTAPIFILFFIISGAKLKLGVMANLSVILIGIVYIIFRSLGKYFGAYVSAKISKAPQTTKKFLGFTLLPQAGVALGMAIKVGEVFNSTAFDSLGVIIANVTIFSVLIYELVGPLITKIALKKAGEIDESGKTSAREKNN